MGERGGLEGWRGREGEGGLFPPVCTLNLNNWQHPTLVIPQRWWFPCSHIPPLPPRHLGSQLAELERAIEKMMEADFVKFAMEDIQQRLQYAQEMATPHSNPERTDSEVLPYCYWHCICMLLPCFNSSVQ